jgi:5'-3' exonuclease
LEAFAVTGHLLLVDASGFAHRAYHAFRPTQRSDGMQTHAVLGYMALLWRTMGRASADPYTYVASVFDPGGKTFRHSLFPAYKANRVPKPGLADQIAFMYEVSRSLGVTPVEAPGFEADDAIATLATRAKNQGIRTTLVSVDKDLCQLVEDGVIEIVDPVKRVRILEADVLKKWGVPPKQLPGFFALMGDAADNLHGVPGCGAKGALQLLTKFKTFDGLLANLDGPAPLGVTLRAWNAVKSCKANLPLWRSLITLRKDVPGLPEFKDLHAVEISKDHILDVLRLLEAESQFENLFGGTEARLYRTVPPLVSDPLAWWRAELKRPGQKIPSVPQVGFYKRRLVQNGAFVPAKIWRQPEVIMGQVTGQDVLYCEVGGQRADPFQQWGYLAMQPITELSFDQMSRRPSDGTKPTNWNEVPI